jgi:hypothetical protein
VIDRFVYNPATTKGQLAITLGKGVLRVVGGVATHSEGAIIRTPVAAIGLRGGIAIISHSGAKGTQAILGFGHMSVTTLCGGGGNCTPNTVQVSRPGFGVTVAGFNGPPPSPSRASSQQLAQSNSQLGSHRGQTGGATQQPTDNLAQSYNVGTPNSPGARVVSTTGAYTAANAVQALNTIGTISRAGAQNTASVVTTQTFIAQSLLKPVIPPPPPPPPVIKPPPPPLTYAMVTSGPFSTSLGASPVPYLTGAFAGTGGFKVSPILGYQAGGLNPGGTPNTTSRQFQAGLSVTGKGVAQNATLFVMTSQISNAPNIGFTQAGGFTAVTVRNGARQFGLATGAVSSATSSATGTPTSPPNTVSTMNGTPIAGFTLNSTKTNLITGAVSPSPSSSFFQSAQANYTLNPITTSTPTFSAGSHPNLTLKGYVGGVMLTANGGTPTAPMKFTQPYVVTNLTGNPGDVGIFLPGNSSEMFAIFNVGSVNTPTNAMKSSTYVFGSEAADIVPVLNGARGAYVNPSNFAARAAESVNGVPASSRNGVSLGSPATPGGFANQQLVTAESVGANTSTFLTSISSTKVTPCACQTQWGFWSAFNGASTNGQLAFEDQGPLLLWVAGTPTVPLGPTGLPTLPATGTATYTGQAIANIANPNNITSYLAAGTFSNTVNFGTRTGAVTIGGLDGTNYAGKVQLVPSAVTFNGTLAGNTGGRTAALNGSFFQAGPTSKIPAFGEIGGSIILSNLPGNPAYLGSGIFAARNLNGVQLLK